MHIKRRLIGASLALVAAAIVFSACSDDDSPAASTSAQPTAQIATLAGTSTTVDLNADTARVLQANGVSVAPVTPATAAVSGGVTSVSFPITGGRVAIYPETDLPFIRGVVNHSGGLTFAAGGKTLTVTDFIVDPGASTLTAMAGGQRVQIMDLNGRAVQVGKDAQGRVLLDGTVAELSQAGADALNQTFGVSIFQKGIPLGVVHIVANGA